jgi:hypothetical protein
MDRRPKTRGAARTAEAGGEEDVDVEQRSPHVRVGVDARHVNG